MPAADVQQTFASVEKARRLLGYAPTTSVCEGAASLWRWYFVLGLARVFERAIDCRE